ncbi:hypothetical protein BFW38_05215 [Terasakiispira papahanaumokuakeensis]|uniref:RHS protein conserved region domain-containing protein n=1 Tax=Terasakiispira papahanaumokuakeensis TaxID=197479 RepID=A0A1E2V8P9_9GAMM|nr:RHS repeat-associated core domain-containing protein [Terasakiispira papahanaumokuakeensis]ODC03035.1 hypothetical protein BFW38_05215 [Terasakiispira papahanaumokuakeensis]
MGNLLKRFADTRYHYDAHGNLTRSITVGGSTWEYRYDAEHRLVEACQYAQAPAAGDSVKAQTKAEYGYDALGRRVWKQVEIDGQAPELTVFTWDGDLLQSETRFEGDIHSPVRSRPPGLIPENPRRKFPRPIAQQVHTLDASDLVPTHTATYLYEPDSFIPLAQLTAGFDHTALAATGTDRQPLRCYQAQTATLYYFQTDHLGTPQDITDTQGHIVWSGQYRAWGQLAQAHNGQGENPNIHNPFRFQGQYHDPETGLHYNRFRYYDPRIGRFTTQDPIGLMGGENLYQYAPNPTGWIDPLGLSKQCCGGGAATTGAKSPKSVESITNPEQAPVILSDWVSKPGRNGGEVYYPEGTNPANGEHIRVMPPGSSPVEEYENGYWRWQNSNKQPMDPSTGKPSKGRGDTHVPLPENSMPPTRKPRK